MNTETRTWIVDSFTDQPFRGNPAGVCLSGRALDAGRMQSIAAELNLSETAFVVGRGDPGQFSIRYFSPKMEIPLCGHATLAAARVLFETKPLKNVQFTTAAQLELAVRSVGELIELEFPVYDLQQAHAPSALLRALGIASLEYCGYNAETRILMLEIGDPGDLAGLRPDFAALLKSHDSIHGVVVTAQASDGFDFHSRYFWPWSGSDEDPVTGGTHTFLAKYWADRLGKSVLRSFQSSRRTGQLEVELAGNRRLLIRGNAIVVFEGLLMI